MLNRLRKDIPYILFVLPALLLFTAFFIVPFGKSIYYSLTNLYSYVPDVEFIGLENYFSCFKDEAFIGSIIVTLKYTLFVVVVVNLVSLALAFILDTNIPGRNALRTIFFVPNVMSLIIVGFVWTFMYGEVFRTLINLLGGVEWLYVSWLGNPDIAIYSIGLTAVWQSAGYAMVIYLSGLQNISQDIVEAAMIDGAGSRAILFKIKIPVLFPVIMMNIILAVTNNLKVFDFPLAMTSGGPGYATTPMALYIYTTGFRAQRTGYATALSVILFLLIGLVTIALVKYLRYREEKLYNGAG